ncbi:MAG: dihydroneopterin aldolase [Candidatus Methylacidiphilales bacterium]|nr:dihydroneopterin aldolase [Candidatus Methylacidiphilales bacterium]
MSDRITIHRLRVPCHLGVPDEERARPQVVEITLSFKAETVPQAAAADDIHLTTNYFNISERIQEVARARPRRLLETLAEDIASVILRDFALFAVDLEIRKFILPDAEAVSLSIKRKRKKIKAPKAAEKFRTPETD